MAFVKLLMTGDATTEVEAEATLVLAGDVTIVGSGKSLEVVNLKTETATELTIGAGGDITRTQLYHNVDTNSDDASDDLIGIIGGADGMMLILRPNNDGRTVVVKHNGSAAATDNILLSNDNDYSMDDEHDVIFLLYEVALDTNGAWIEISRGTGGSAVLTDAAPADVGTTAAVGAGSLAARENHVHDTASGFIDNVNKFASSVVDNAAMADNAIANAEIADNAVDTAELNTNAVGFDAIDTTDEAILFSQIILNPKTTGSGTTEGTLFYDSDDDHLYVFTVA